MKKGAPKNRCAVKKRGVRQYAGRNTKKNEYYGNAKSVYEQQCGPGASSGGISSEQT